MLELRGVGKSFAAQQGSVPAIRNIELTVAPGEFCILLGPSGCGKTTTLRSIAGLERPDTGLITIDGKTVFSAEEGICIRPEYREIAMVFQSYAIWPHMSVYENIAFPLREGVRRVSPVEVRRRVDDMLHLFGLTEVGRRSATSLSGGQQQRVALARALALRPKILLMDEPLSNLDLALQTRLRSELKKLVRDSGLTTIYVTHNQAEAMEMGDRLAVMNDGRIAQTGTPIEVYGSPEGEFVARFIGEISLVAARIVRLANGFAVLDTSIGRMGARAPCGSQHSAGDGCFLGIRPEDLALLPSGATADPDANVIAGQVVQSRFTGESWVHRVRAGGAELSFKTHYAHPLAPGAHVRLTASPTHCATVIARNAERPPLAPSGQEAAIEIAGSVES